MSQQVNLSTTEDPLLFTQLQGFINQKKLPQAVLFLGSHKPVLDFVTKLIAQLLCQQKEKCNQCGHCNLLDQGFHPDVTLLKQEEADKAIRIDQIRALLHDVYQTPKKGYQRFIIITAADKMNHFAANALLKILEEPPVHTTFVLIAEKVTPIPATIRSRCQRYVLNSLYLTNYFSWFFLPENQEKKGIFIQIEPMLEALYQITTGIQSPNVVASSWIEYQLEDVLAVLYLICAQAIRCQLLKQSNLDYESFVKLIPLITSLKWFNQLEQIKALIKKINHNIQINALLSLENLLLGFA